MRILTPEKTGHLAVQLGAEDMKLKRLNKPMMGYYASCDMQPKRKLMEFKITPDAIPPLGWTMDCRHFVPGQYVDVKGLT
jgi:large subunit ribosomal protein L3